MTPPSLVSTGIDDSARADRMRFETSEPDSKSSGSATCPPLVETKRSRLTIEMRSGRKCYCGRPTPYLFFYGKFLAAAVCAQHLAPEERAIVELMFKSGMRRFSI